MSKNIQAIRGMHDILPDDMHYWHFIEAQVRQLLAGYGYREIRMPLVEKTELFKRSIGEVTDIVEKEMYTFEDRNGDMLSLRPEGTASSVRAGLEHGLFHNQVQKLWYNGAMFRHERPQKGRYRQFHQVGVEVFGLEGPDIDAELIIMSRRLWRQLGLMDHVRLEINSLGTPASRAHYREALVDFLRARFDQLDEDSQRRLETNPLRVLDSKSPQTRAALEGAPDLRDFLCEASRSHVERLRELLDAAGIEYVVNPHLVRGLDYYSRTVFEWVTDALGAQGTVCAGGRFDGLVPQLGGKPTPAVGFAMGLERLIALLQDTGVTVAPQAPHAYLMSMGEAAEKSALVLAERLRDEVPALQLVSHCGGGSFKSQMRKADRSGARWALILGKDEAAAGEITLKPLREEMEQQRLAQSALADWLKQALA